MLVLVLLSVIVIVIVIVVVVVVVIVIFIPTIVSGIKALFTSEGKGHDDDDDCDWNNFLIIAITKHQ